MADAKTEHLTGRASIVAGTYIGGELQQTPSQKAAAGSQPKVETVSMEVLRDGSYGGEYRYVGDTVDVPSTDVEHLTLGGFAARADRVAVAKQARDEKAADAKPDDAAADATADSGKAKPTAVKPMSTKDVPHGKAKSKE